MEKLLNYINGKLVEPAGGTYFDNYHPATGTVYSQIPDSGAAGVAAQAGKAAFAASTAACTSAAPESGICE